MTEVTPAIRLSRRVAPFALLLVIAAACGDDDKSTAPPNEPPPPSTSTARQTDGPPPPAVPSGSATKGGKASLRMGRRNLLLFLEGPISQFASGQVEGKSVQVVAVVGPDAFWVGQKGTRRILVKLRLKGTSPPNVKVGQKASFIGVLRAARDPASLGVTSDPDKELLAKQGAYVDVSFADVKLR